MEPINLQIERSSSTTKTFGFVEFIKSKQGHLPARSRPDRDRNREYRPLPYLTFYKHIASVAHGNFLDEGQAEAEAALLAGFFVTAAIEFFEDLRHFGSGNPIALVGYREPHGAT